MKENIVQLLTFFYVMAILLLFIKVVFLPGSLMVADSRLDERAAVNPEDVDILSLQLLDIPEFSQIDSIVARKTAFFNFLGHYVEYENRQVLAERAQVLHLGGVASSGELSAAQKVLLRKLAARYKLVGTAEHELIVRLQNRIDIIPPSLALSQSANESALGTSRFAREGNNFFGQWCFRQGCGIVPRSRPAGEIYEVAAFDDAGTSVRAYFLNLNTHSAYKRMRDIRSNLRAGDKVLSGSILALGLERYSSRGKDYVDEIKKMIVSNKLGSLDSEGSLELFEK